MTIQEKIEVMQHFANGGEVEIEISKDNWVVDYNPTWSWSYFEYRIKQEPKKMVKLYKFAYKEDDGWVEHDYFHEDTEDFIRRVIGDNKTVIRLDYTMIEVEED